MQKANPTTDTFNEGYTNDTGGSTNLFQAIDEGFPFSDTDYIKAPLAPTNDVYVTKASATEDPQSSTGHIVRFRYAKDTAGGAQIDLTVQLRQGYIDEGTPGTLIHEKAITNIGNTFVDDSFTLTAGEADSITDYSNLFFRIAFNQV